MEQRITFITLGVKDLERMKSFYNTAFGWLPMKDSDGIVFYKLNGFILGLYPVEELASDIGVVNDGTGFRRMTLAINFNSEGEVNDRYSELVSKGARSVLQPEKVFWGGYRGYVADPEDNYWELAFNPFLKLNPSGDVIKHD